MNSQFFHCILIQELFNYNWISHIFCLQGDNVPARIEKLNQADLILKLNQLSLWFYQFCALS